jgi:uncharacterized protein YjiS (DUF1127 family)
MIGDIPFWKTAFSRERSRAAIDIDGLPGAPLQRLAILLSAWRKRGAERRRLQGLGDHLLNDMGVSRRDVEHGVHDFGARRGHAEY